MGWITISGSGPYTGEQYDIYIKNEQIAGWKNRETDVVPPNMLWVLDPHTGLPVTGTPPGIVPEGKEVSVLGIVARGAWDSRKGSKLMGPSHFRLENLKLPE